MANQFVTLQEIARSALPVLRDSLVFPALVHTDFSDCALNKGDTVQVRKPSVFTAQEFDPDAGVTAQDFTETAVAVTLDKIATVDVEVSALQAATSLSDLENQFILPAAAALAEKINADGLALYKDIPYAYTGGVATLDDYAEIRKCLNERKIPNAPRRAVWGAAADAALTKISAFVNAEKTGDNRALREGAIGKLFGVENYMSQSVPVHTAGTLAKSGSGDMTVKTAVSDADAVVITGADGTLVKGDLIAIDGKTYTVTEAATAASGDITAKVYPNITADAGTVVTKQDSHTANLVFHPMAFGYVTRPLPAPAGATSYVTSYNGLTLRVTRGYDMRYKKELISMDVLYGFKTLYPELALRVPV